MKTFTQIFARKSNKQRVLYYASHHSYTHVRSAIALARLLPETEFYIVTPEQFKLPVPNNVQVRYLTKPNFAVRLNNKIHLHRYSYEQNEPIISSHRNHVTEFINHIHDIEPHLVIIDLLAEFAVIAKFLGYPVAFFYETIDNSRERIKVVWQSVDSIIARYSESFVRAVEENIPPNMFCGGGVSRYDFKPELTKQTKSDIRRRLSIGENESVVTFISGSKTYETKQASEYYEKIFQAMENTATKKFVLYPEEDQIVRAARKLHPTFTFVINPDEPFDYLRSADVIISGGGMGVVMESCVANNPLLILPVPWIFDEQNRKAAVLEKIGVARSLDSRVATAEKIGEEIRELQKSDLAEIMKNKQTSLIDGQGYRRIADHIRRLLESDQCKKGVSLSEK